MGCTRCLNCYMYRGRHQNVYIFPENPINSSDANVCATDKTLTLQIPVNKKKIFHEVQSKLHRRVYVFPRKQQGSRMRQFCPGQMRKRELVVEFVVFSGLSRIPRNWSYSEQQQQRLVRRTNITRNRWTPRKYFAFGIYRGLVHPTENFFSPSG